MPLRPVCSAVQYNTESKEIFQVFLGWYHYFVIAFPSQSDSWHENKWSHQRWFLPPSNSVPRCTYTKTFIIVRWYGIKTRPAYMLASAILLLRMLTQSSASMIWSSLGYLRLVSPISVAFIVPARTLTLSGGADTPQDTQSLQERCVRHNKTFIYCWNNIYCKVWR